MKSSYNTEIWGDNSYYASPVSERLSHDAYMRYEMLLDDYADVGHLIGFGEPVRVASAPDRRGIADGREYVCDRCGRVTARHSNLKGAIRCRDCQVVERLAAPVPVESPEERRFRLDPPTPVERKEVEDARMKRRLKIVADQQRAIREQQGELLRAYMEKVDARKLAKAEGREVPPPSKIAAPSQAVAPELKPDTFRVRTKAERKAELADRKELQEQAKADRLAKRLARQADAARLFLADLEESNAEWLLAKRI